MASTNFDIRANLSQRDEAFCDIILRSKDGIKVPAHFAILAIESYYMEKFKFKYSEIFHEEPPIQVLGRVKGDILTQLVEYCYSGEISIGEHNDADILAAAVTYEFHNIQHKCYSYFVNKMTTENCSKIFRIARTNSFPGLQLYAISFFCCHFREVMHSIEFTKLEYVELKELLEYDELIIRSEVDVCNAIKIWIMHDRRNRLPMIRYIADVIKLEDLETEYMRTSLQNLFLYSGHDAYFRKMCVWKICQNQNCTRKKKLPNSGKKRDLAGIVKSDSQSTTIIRTLRVKKEEQNIPSANAGIRNVNAPLRDVFAEESQQIPQNVVKKTEYVWEQKYVISQRKSHDYIFFLNEYVIFDVGLEFEVHNMTRKKETSRVSVDKEYYSGVVFAESIYLIGGRNDKSVLRFNLDKELKHLAPMIVPRMSACSVVHSARIYVMCGKNNEQILQSGECYNPFTDKWTPMVWMSDEICPVDATATDGYIYLLNSRSVDNTTKVYRYDVKADLWDQIFCISSDKGYVNSISAYNDGLIFTRSMDNKYIDQIFAHKKNEDKETPIIKRMEASCTIKVDLQFFTHQ